MAVGVPSPPFPGNPLDPPLRSRFQARHVRRATTQSLLLALRVHYAPSVHSNVLEELLSIYESLWALGDTQASTSEIESKALAFSELCYPCEQSIISAGRLLEYFPNTILVDVLHRIFPYSASCGMLTDGAAKLIYHLLHSSLLLEGGDSLPHYRLVSSQRINAGKISLLSFSEATIQPRTSPM